MAVAGPGGLGLRTCGRLVARDAAGPGRCGGCRGLLRLVRQAGLRGWVRAFPFGTWTVDLAFPAFRLAVEIDGWAWHVDRDRFANDRRKGNALVAAGWTVLRFTWSDLVDTPTAPSPPCVGHSPARHDHHA